MARIHSIDPEPRPIPMMVPVSGGCWMWTGTLSPRGYAYQTESHARPRTDRVARRHYEAFNGPMPRDLVVDHLCRNRACVNPSHMEAVTIRTNVMRGIGITARNAVATHCKSGHEFTKANTRITPKGGRSCRTCAREAWRRKNWS